MGKPHKLKIEPDRLLRAFLKRKHDILRPDMTLLPPNNRGWSLLASDLGNAYTPGTLINLIRRPHIIEVLTAENSRTRTPSSVPNLSKGRPRKPLYELAPHLYPREKKHNKSSYEIPTRTDELVLPEGYLKNEPTEEKPIENLETLINDEKLNCSCEVVLSPCRPAKEGSAAKRVKNEIMVVNVDCTTEDFDDDGIIVNEKLPRVERKIEQSAASSEISGNSFSKAKRGPALIHAIRRTKMGDEVLFFNVDCKTEPIDVSDDDIHDTVTDDIYAGKSKSNNVANGGPISIQAAGKLKNEKMSTGLDDATEQVKHDENYRVVKKGKIRPGNRSIKVHRNIMIDAILARSADIVVSEKCRLVSVNHPVWQQISNALGNKVCARYVRNIAVSEEVFKMLVHKERKIVNVFENSEEQNGRNNVERDLIINALLNHREEIVLHDGKLVSNKNPVWLRIAEELGNDITAADVWIVAQKQEFQERLIIEDKQGIATSSRRSDRSRKCEKIDPVTTMQAGKVTNADVHDKRNIRHVNVKETCEESDNLGNISNEITQVMFEDGVRTLLRSIDSTDEMKNVLKDLRENLRQDLRNEMQGLRERQSTEIQGLRNDLQRMKERVSMEVQELRNDLHEAICSDGKGIRFN